MIKYIKIIGLCIGFLCFMQGANAQPCYPGEIVTAAYATGGSSSYINKVLWLTWGSTNQATYPYGQHNQSLGVGSKSYASIPLGGDQYLCIEAEITAITDGAVNSYASGNYSGDSLDDLYNIGGTGTSNKLVAGIRNRNDGATSTLTISCKATLGGAPVRIAGLVLADAEALSSSEYINATADGVWTVVEVKKNTSAGVYNITKVNNNPSTTQTINFLRGNDNNTAAVSFLSFNSTAYATQDLSITFSAALKGGGLTAMALGLLTPIIDLGDAPKSYGDPAHLSQNLTLTDDNITARPNTLSAKEVNINTDSYTSGTLESSSGAYLGSTPPDADNGPMYSIDALGDDKSPTANPLAKEEDAWPDKYKRFSYKTNYMPGNKIEAEISYKGGANKSVIAGWIDFDLNGKFDDYEMAKATVKGNGNGTVTLIWTVPANRRPISTYVRLRYFDPAQGQPNPTNIVNYGEVEDHRIYILAPTITNPSLPSKAK